MSVTAGRASNLIGSLGGLSSTLLAIAQNRLALLAAELEDGRLQSLQLLAWTLSGLFLFGIGWCLLLLTLVLAFAGDQRLLLLAGLATLHLLLAGLALLLSLRLSKRLPALFSSSLDELGKDRAALERLS